MIGEQLTVSLRAAAPLAVAVSGGVDSLTLLTAARRLLGRPAVLAVHATSPAVPGEATERVRTLAMSEGLDLEVIEAGEFDDPAYRANPVNRCFYCKTDLYGAIRRITDRQIVSGTNLDDLGEYRPGLDAARNHSVRHPFVEAGMNKAAVRMLARKLGLGEIAELPAAPCLSSRIETGIRVEPGELAFVHRVEQLVGQRLRGSSSRTVRCRVRKGGLVIELDSNSLAQLDPSVRAALAEQVGAQAPASLSSCSVAFAPYRTGSAFLVQQP
jgi:uncharacterized protein